MTNRISAHAFVDPNAQLGDEIEVGPFCVVGPDVSLGHGCILSNNVTITGHTSIGERNRFFPGSVIGAEPQDFCYAGGPTKVVIR